MARYNTRTHRRLPAKLRSDSMEDSTEVVKVSSDEIVDPVEDEGVDVDAASDEELVDPEEEEENIDVDDTSDEELADPVDEENIDVDDTSDEDMQQVEVVEPVLTTTRRGSVKASAQTLTKGSTRALTKTSTKAFTKVSTKASAKTLTKASTNAFRKASTYLSSPQRKAASTVPDPTDSPATTASVSSMSSAVKYSNFSLS